MQIQKLQVSSCCILSDDDQLKQGVLDQLAMHGIGEEQVLMSADASELVATASEGQLCMFVVDLRVGLGNALDLLSELEDSHKRLFHPVVIVAEFVTSEHVALAAEFGALGICTSEYEGLVREVGSAVSVAQATSGIYPHLREVAAARKVRNWAKAEEILKTLRSLREDDETILLELAENYIQTGNWQEALDLLRPFESQKEQVSARALHMLGRCMMHFGRVGEAVKLMEGASILNPNNIQRLVDLGQAYLAIDRTVDAKNAFERVLAFRSSHQEARVGLARIELTDGEISQGINLIRNLANAHELGAVFNYAAIATLHRGDLDRSLELYDTAINMVDTEPQLLAKLYFNKGVAYCKFARNEPAIGCFEQAVNHDPAHGGANHNLKVLRLRGVESSDSQHSSPDFSEHRPFDDGEANDFESADDFGDESLLAV